MRRPARDFDEGTRWEDAQRTAHTRGRRESGASLLEVGGTSWGGHGHIFYGLAGALTLSHYAQGHGPVLEALAEVGDIFNPLSLGQDLIDLYEMFIPDADSARLLHGVAVSAPASANPFEHSTSPEPFLYGLSAYGHHTGNFTSIHDLFLAGKVCIDPVCMY